jgi:acyl-CoA synthetase (AMP-forming)/AMP-acid ligase II
VAAGELSRFLRDREISGLWLTSGLFRLVADDEPAAFRRVRQLLTGGDVVPPGQARRVLDQCPGLRLTNGYGPTENTTFTTVHHVDDAVAVDDPLPIGRPIAGTTVTVLDDDGELLPPGAVGELCAAGDGVAVDYLDAPAETARSFVRPPAGPRYYRTGDLVRWDGAGRLRYLGRRDQQVKVRGFRVELAAVARVLRGHPQVRDAVVAATTDPGERRLVAGVIADPHPDLVGSLRTFAEQRLPGYAVPALWARVDVLPVTANGKVDVSRLLQLARAFAPPPVAMPADDFDLDELLRSQP